MVINTINEEMSFCDYYSQWVDVYKEGAIREVTMKKYKLTQAWLRKLIPDLKLITPEILRKLVEGLR